MEQSVVKDVRDFLKDLFVSSLATNVVVPKCAKSLKITATVVNIVAFKNAYQWE